VPEGKRLFFPIVNSVNIDTPNVCGQGPGRIPVAELRALSAAFVDGAVHVSVGLDGKPISDLTRIQSKVFEVALPEENLFDEPCTGLGGVPAGIYSPAVDDGVYALLDEMKKGEHELNFHAENPSQNFVLDVTYHLTVVPVRVTRPHIRHGANDVEHSLRGCWIWPAQRVAMAVASSTLTSSPFSSTNAALRLADAQQTAAVACRTRRPRKIIPPLIASSSALCTSSWEPAMNRLAAGL